MQKPLGESWESFIERRIREAQAGGEFDKLPGFGQPIPDIDQPWDENSWVRQKLRAEQINELPPILAARLDKERTLESLANLTTEAEVLRCLAALNARIQKSHFAAVGCPNISVFPVEIDEELRRWKSQQSS